MNPGQQQLHKDINNADLQNNVPKHNQNILKNLKIDPTIVKSQKNKIRKEIRSNRELNEIKQNLSLKPDLNLLELGGEIKDSKKSFSEQEALPNSLHRKFIQEIEKLSKNYSELQWRQQDAQQANTRAILNNEKQEISTDQILRQLRHLIVKDHRYNQQKQIAEKDQYIIHNAMKGVANTKMIQGRLTRENRKNVQNHVQNGLMIEGHGYHNQQGQLQLNLPNVQKNQYITHNAMKGVANTKMIQGRLTRENRKNVQNQVQKFVHEHEQQQKKGLGRNQEGFKNR